MVLSIFGACAPGGFVLGAMGSGLCAQLGWWPWAYWVLGVLLFVVAGLAVIIVSEMPVVGGKARVGEIDLLGSTLGVVGLVLVNFAWNLGPALGWQTVYVYVLLIVGFGVLAAFFYVEGRDADFPLVPLKDLTKDTLFVFGCIAAGWSSFGIWVFYLWQMLEVERGHSVLLAAAQVSPSAISGLCAAITTGFLISKFQPGWIMLASMTAFAIGIILLATMPVEQNYWSQTFISTLITSWGMYMSFPSGIIVLSNSMPEEHQGLAASLINTVVNYSISIGLGMAGTVESHVNDGGKNTLKGYRGAWYLGIGLDVLGMVLALCLVVSWRATLRTKAREEEKLRETP
jgi:MFS family permease